MRPEAIEAVADLAESLLPRFNDGEVAIAIPREGYLQVAYLGRKGSDAALRALDLAPGDEVLGLLAFPALAATHAEYVVASVNELVRKPAGLSSEAALRGTVIGLSVDAEYFDALAKVHDHAPQLIFCDILMPRLDGYQTCAIIKRNPQFSAVPVIMLSSKDGLFDKARGRIVGSEQYLTKPFTREELLGAIRTYVNA